MKIYNTISFRSRNYEIRRADDIAREITKKYPMISSSKISSYPKANLFPDTINRIDNKLGKTRMDAIKALSAYNFDITPKDKILNFLKIMKKDKLGNCAEMTDLASIFAFLKGIKNTSRADIKNTAEEFLDHTVLYVDNDKKPYIIDPWLGFADYLPNAIQRYKSEFSNFFPFKLATSQDFMFRKYKYPCDAKKALNECTISDLLKIRKVI